MVVVGRRVCIKSILALLAVKPLRAHQPLMLQPTQRTIDRGEIQRGVALVRMAVDLLGGWMAGKRFDGLQYEPALYRDTPALFLQALNCSVEKCAHRRCSHQTLLQMICNKSMSARSVCQCELSPLYSDNCHGISENAYLCRATWRIHSYALN